MVLSTISCNSSEDDVYISQSFSCNSKSVPCWDSMDNTTSIIFVDTLGAVFRPKGIIVNWTVTSMT